MKQGIKAFAAPLALTGLFALLIFFSIPAGSVYGSNIDWLSQHAALAETIRNACLEQHTLLPDVLALGGGSNGFLFSYYGYLRPDILIGCLLPAIPMYQILTVYMLAGYLISGLLFYLWLRREGKTGSSELGAFDAFLGSALFLTAGCFFMTHRQVMFVNYMPFLMLSLLAVQGAKRKVPPLLPLWMLLICLNSFYYAPACFLLLGWYWFQRQGKAFFGPWFVSSALAGSMSAALLLPTGLAILEHRRLSESADAGFLTFFKNLNSLLYISYGVGLGMLVLYLLLLGLGFKTYRKTSLFFLVVFFWGGISYLLNAGLYARAKILMPFLPLVLLHCTRLLAKLRARELPWRLWPFPILLFVGLLYRKRDSWPLIAADLLILAAVVLIQLFLSRRKASETDSEKNAGAAQKSLQALRVLSLLCLLIIPAVNFLTVSATEDFVTEEKLEKALAVPDCLVETDPLYRYDNLEQPMTKSNMDVTDGRQKTAMYSSVYSADYSRVYYDLLKTPIQINNRLAILPANNPFLLYFMGVRHAETAADQIPDGYRLLWKNETTAVSENTSVLPMAYLSDEVLPKTVFDTLTGWETAEALTRYTVISEDVLEDESLLNSGSLVQWQSMLQSFSPVWEEVSLPSALELTALRNEETDSDSQAYQLQSGYDIQASRETTFSLSLKEPLRQKLLLLQFEVENHTGNAVLITINGVKNKLSAPSAPYPNGNDCFSFAFLDTTAEGLDTLEITLPKGHYTLKNIRFFLLPASVFSEKDWTAVEALETGKRELLACRAKAEKDTWFITSIPRQNGMKLLVDGKPQEIVTVNEAFVGARLCAGEHEIRLSLDPPGKTLGLLGSAAGAGCWLLLLFLKKKQGRHTME